MAGLLRYARVSTEAQDLTSQRDALQGLGVAPDRIYVDHGLSGTTRARPGLAEALAACRSGEQLVVSKFDRLARSLPDAPAIADELARRHVKLNLARRGSPPLVRAPAEARSCLEWLYERGSPADSDFPGCE